MKRILRHFTVDTVSLYLASSVASGLFFKNGLETLLLTGLGLTLASLIAKPVINILLLPVNLITFGLFRWVAAAITLYLVTLVVPGFAINGFNFGGFSGTWIDIPQIVFNGFLAIVAFSFIHSVFSSFIYWLLN